MIGVVLALFIASVHAVDVRVGSATNPGFASAASYKCDGVSDNEQIQAALDYVGKSGGGTVYLSDGLFVFSKNVDIKYSFIKLRGAGRESTVLKLKNSASKFSKAGFIRSMNTQYIEVRDLTIDGNRANQSKDTSTNYGRYGIYTETCNYTTLDNLLVRNWYGYGLDPHGASSIYAPGYHTTITNCVVRDNAYDGITVDKTEHSLVSGNTIVNNARHGINIVTGSKFANIYGNTITNNGWWYEGKPGVGCGIMLQNNQFFDTRDAVVHGNTIVNASRAGICLTDVENIEIYSNVITLTNICMRLKNITCSSANISVAPDNQCSSSYEVKDDTGGCAGFDPAFQKI